MSYEVIELKTKRQHVGPAAEGFKNSKLATRTRVVRSEKENLIRRNFVQEAYSYHIECILKRQTFGGYRTNVKNLISCCRRAGKG